MYLVGSYTISVLYKKNLNFIGKIVNRHRHQNCLQEKCHYFSFYGGISRYNAHQTFVCNILSLQRDFRGCLYCRIIQWRPQYQYPKNLKLGLQALDLVQATGVRTFYLNIPLYSIIQYTYVYDTCTMKQANFRVNNIYV